MAHLITGHAGIEHIKPSDDGAFNIGIFGQNQFVFPIGEQFGYEIISNNLIKIKSGELVNQGRHINIPVNNYEEVTIENGLQGVKRHDIIVMRYERNPDTNIESASLVVLKGTSSVNPNDPSMTLGNIYEGANVSDMPLYRVYLDGLNIEKVESMFTVMPSLPTVNAKAEQNAEDIANIKNNLANVDVKSVTPGANTTTQSGVVFKYGRMCIFTGIVRAGSEGIPANTVLCTVPYKPTREVVGLMGFAGAQSAVNVRITTNGEVVATNNSVAANSYMVFNMSYVTTA